MAEPSRTIWPRFMKRATAADYLDMSAETFDGWVADGLMPPPIQVDNRHPRWDRHDIDRRADELPRARVSARNTMDAA